jgi:hypothetical protein
MQTHAARYRARKSRSSTTRPSSTHSREMGQRNTACGAKPRAKLNCTGFKSAPPLHKPHFAHSLSPCTATPLPFRTAVVRSRSSLLSPCSPPWLGPRTLPPRQLATSPSWDCRRTCAASCVSGRACATALPAVTVCFTTCKLLRLWQHRGVAPGDVGPRRINMSRARVLVCSGCCVVRQQDQGRPGDGCRLRRSRVHCPLPEVEEVQGRQRLRKQRLYAGQGAVLSLCSRQVFDASPFAGRPTPTVRASHTALVATLSSSHHRFGSAAPPATSFVAALSYIRAPYPSIASSRSSLHDPAAPCRHGMWSCRRCRTPCVEACSYIPLSRRWPLTAHLNPAAAFVLCRCALRRHASTALLMVRTGCCVLCRCHETARLTFAP